MALHLVTGYKGTAHITSADQGLFNAGIAGVDEYVLSIGNKLDASIINNNTVRIADGCLITQGRHVNLDSYLDATISNGTQSMNRNDLIVMRYEKNQDTGVESVSLKVITGTAVSGTATDPSYNTSSIFNGAITHDMPLYRVKLSGLNIASVEPMFTILAPLSEANRGFYRQNMLINGDFQCNQRGNKSYDVADTAAYTVDMWRAYQVKVDVLNDGVKITGKSASVKGYFTQFIQLGKLETTTYTISAMADGKLCVFTVTPGGSAKEMDFGTFKISALTTSSWDNNLPEYNYYNNKLKINICPVGTNTIKLEYVNVFVGTVAYPHVKEDKGTAMVRCRRYIQRGVTTCPIIFRYSSTTSGQNAYRFGIPIDEMESIDNAIFTDGSWSYFDTAGTTKTFYYDSLEILNKGNRFIEVKTGSINTLAEGATGIRTNYVLSCEPRDA